MRIDFGDAHFLANPNYKYINGASDNACDALSLPKDHSIYTGDGMFKPVVSILPLISASAFSSRVFNFCGSPMSFEQLKENFPLKTLLLKRVILNMVEASLLTMLVSNESYTGDGALPLIIKSNDRNVHPGNNPIVDLSFRGIRYAQILKEMNPSALAYKLYKYNSDIPADWLVTAYETKNSVQVWNLHRILEAVSNEYNYKLNYNNHWAYAKKSSFEEKANHQNRFLYKLYVSPVYDNFRQSLTIITENLTAIDPFCFKFGNDLQGCLRPDKIVLYFQTRKELESAASILEFNMKNINPLGVPFSCPYDSRGLLSFGVDPVKSARYSAPDPVSWRVWITQKLANDIISFNRLKDGKLSLQSFLSYKFNNISFDIENWVIKKHFNF